MNRRHWYWLTAAVIFNVIMSFLTPVNQSVLDRYHISLATLHFITTTFLIPLILIWTAAIYGYAHLRGYSRLIKKDQDGKGLSKIATGMGILAGGMIVSSLVSSVIGYFSATRLSLVPANVIISNYISVVLTLSSFWFLYQGSQCLIELIPKHDHRSRRVALLVVYAVAAVFYCIRALHNPLKRTPATYTSHGLYYLPDILILLTILLPNVIAWALGILTTINLVHYRHNVKGIIYRQALQYMGIGFSMVIIASLFEQILSLFEGSVQNASLSALLALIYVLLIFIGVGFLMIARGAKRLKQLEGL